MKINYIFQKKKKLQLDEGHCFKCLQMSSMPDLTEDSWVLPCDPAFDLVQYHTSCSF